LTSGPPEQPPSSCISFQPTSRYTYGVVLSGGMYCVHLKRAEGLAQMVGAQVPPEVRELDVTVLHSFILERILGISREAQEKKLNLDYMERGGGCCARLFGKGRDRRDFS